MLKVRESLLKPDSSLRLGKIRDAFVRSDKLFLVTVVLPTLAAILYFGFLASDVYVSESQFVVRSPDKPATTGLGVLLRSTGFSNTGDEIYAAQNFVRSRDALKALNTNGAVERAYSNPEVSIVDRFNPLGLSGTFEDLYDYYRGKVGIQYDTTSSVATLTVKAFDPQDAYRFNRQLLGLAEAVVNRLNERGRSDLVEFAEREVRDAQIEDRNAAVALARYRNGHGVVDPEEQAKVQLEMISKLQDELIGARMQLLQLQQMAPENPQIPVLKTRVAGLAHEIDVQMGRVAGDRGSLSASAAQYQRLELERQFAEKRLAAAMTSLQEAQSEARRKQAYVERIVQPNLADEAAEPRRLRGVIATLVIGLVVWGILKLLIAGIREHHT
jgi:capsular polysaccharide transport system permease protein